MKYIELSEENRLKAQRLEVEILAEVDRLCKKHSLRYSIAYGTLIGAVRHNGFIPWDDDIDICMPREDYEKLQDICKEELDGKFFYQSHDTDPGYWLLYNKMRMNGTVFKETASAYRNIHQGVYIDIFPIVNIPDDTKLLDSHLKKIQFYRTGIQAKHIVWRSRHGKKMLVVALLRLIYLVFPIKYLYRKAQEEAVKYNSNNTNRMISTCSPYQKKDIFNREVYLNYIEHVFEGHQFSIYKDYDKVLTQIYGNYMQLPPEEKRITRHPLVEVDL